MVGFVRGGCMNFFDRSLGEYEGLQKRYNPSYESVVPQKKASLTPADWAGIGLQLYGATLQDKAAEEDKRERLEDKRFGRMIAGRQDREAAEQFERTAMQTDRSQNISGFDRLADMRERAMKNAPMFSFRKSFLKAMGA